MNIEGMLVGGRFRREEIGVETGGRGRGFDDRADQHADLEHALHDADQVAPALFQRVVRRARPVYGERNDEAVAISLAAAEFENRSRSRPILVPRALERLLSQAPIEDVEAEDGSRQPDLRGVENRKVFRRIRGHGNAAVGRDRPDPVTREAVRDRLALMLGALFSRDARHPRRRQHRILVVEQLLGEALELRAIRLEGLDRRPQCQHVVDVLVDPALQHQEMIVRARVEVLARDPVLASLSDLPADERQCKAARRYGGDDGAP